MAVPTVAASFSDGATGPRAQAVSLNGGTDTCVNWYSDTNVPGDHWGGGTVPTKGTLGAAPIGLSRKRREPLANEPPQQLSDEGYFSPILAIQHERMHTALRGAQLGRRRDRRQYKEDNAGRACVLSGRRTSDLTPTATVTVTLTRARPPRNALTRFLSSSEPRRHT